MNKAVVMMKKRRTTNSILTVIMASIVLTACYTESQKTPQNATTQDVTNPMIIKKPSAHNVKDTIDRLENILNAKGLMVFTRVNHAAGAQNVGLNMADSELIIFGNPKLGTPLMTENPEMGLDLPLKALAYTDGAGQTFLTYTAPKALQERHNITVNGGVIEKMTGALDAMTSKAVTAD